MIACTMHMVAKQCGKRNCNIAQFIESSAPNKNYFSPKQFGVLKEEITPKTDVLV